MKVLLIVVVILIVFYIFMIVDTNGLIENVKDVFLGKVDKSITDGTILEQYNVKGWYQSDHMVMDARVSRLFVLHNFFDGYIWVKYSYEGQDEHGEVMTGASASSRWKIHKNNGKWEIVDIKEKP